MALQTPQWEKLDTKCHASYDSPSGETNPRDRKQAGLLGVSPHCISSDDVSDPLSTEMGRDPMCPGCFVNVPKTQPALSLKVCRVMVANTCLLGSSSRRPFGLSPVPYSVSLQFGKVVVMGRWHLGAYGRNSVCGLWGGGSACHTVSC